MSDAKIIVMTLGVAAGAYFPLSLPVWIPLAMVLGALIAKKQQIFVLSLVLLAAAHSYQQWHQLQRPLPHVVIGDAVLVTDPEPSGSAQRAEVKLQQRHFELWTTGAMANDFQTMQAGEHILLRATVRELSGRRAPGLRRKHVAATLTATSIVPVSRNDIRSTLPNGLRRLIEHGAVSLSPDNHALLTGLLYGDDRKQSAESIEEFRNSGLAHLTAVSGANVAFALLLLTPAWRAFGLLGRFAGGVGTLLVFGALTRWEPSVVRAEAMAAVVLFASLIGRPISLLRTMCLATTATLLADPFLIGSIGFLLSIVAVGGMALFGKRIAEECPGNLAFRRFIGYSAAAQLSVAPLQFIIFGKLPVVGLFTNLLADPVAGAVMMWGLGAGLLAGVLGSPIAMALQLPTSAMLEWIRLIARCGAAADSDPVVRWLVCIVPMLALVSWKWRASADIETAPVFDTLNSRE